MADPLILDESITVNRPVEEAFAYVAMFSRIEEWDPGVARGTSLTPGAPAVGSEFLIEMKAGFDLRYRIVELEPGSRILMNVESRFFTAQEEILFSAEADDQTTIRYIATFAFPAALRMLNRLYPKAMVRVGKSTMNGLQAALEGPVETPVASASLALADRLVVPGVWRFTSLGYRAARRGWKPMSSWLGGQHAVVTGATSGVGLAAARELAALGATVTLVARNKSRAEAVVSDIIAATGNASVRFELCDMSLMSDVHALVRRLRKSRKAIDILVNNAGALFNDREMTEEGLERSFALLLLAPYVLTEGVRPLLSAGSRVVNVTSGGMYTQKIRVGDLQFERGEYAGAVAYARAKRGLMILTEEWAREWAADGVVVNAMHPGWADTPGVEKSLPGFYQLTRRVLRTPEEGADTAVWLAAAPEAALVSGKLWLDRAQHPAYLFAKTRETAKDREVLLRSLHDLSESTAPGKKKKAA